ncbi:MAG: VOC family protein [Anaerolineales bacterium]|nr:VOC family protein [Anaerolineales bacterium]
MTILSIDHVQLALPAGEEEKARAFYVGILGFTEIHKPPELAKRGGMWLQNVPLTPDQTAVELPSDQELSSDPPSETVRVHLGVENDFHPARKAHPAFIVSRLDSLLEKIQAAGYEWDLSQPPLEGYNRAHVFDPFGNRIELMERT